MRVFRVLTVTLALLAFLATEVAAVRADTVVPAEQKVVDTARARVAAGDLRGALAVLAPYVAAHRDALAAGRLLGDLYFRVPDFKKAESTWMAVLAAHRDDRETHNRLGALYAAQDRIDDAIAEFQKSLPSSEGYAGLVMAHKRAGDLPSYVADVELRTRNSPLDASAWSTLGQVRRAMHEYGGALEAFEHAVTLRSRSCDTRVDVANALVDLGRVDHAMTHLRACLAFDAHYYPAIVNLGEAFLEKRQPAAARPYFDRALAIKPDGAEAMIDIGYLHDLRGDWRSAIAYYTRAMVADPLRPEAYIDLGYDYAEHRLYPLAEAAYLKGLSVASDSGRLHYLLAVAYNLEGKIGLARQQYERAISSDEPAVVRAAKRELTQLPPGR
jgi:tetratricopeptide (TPR) repeat protein